MEEEAGEQAEEELIVDEDAVEDENAVEDEDAVEDEGEEMAGAGAARLRLRPRPKHDGAAAAVWPSGGVPRSPVPRARCGSRRGSRARGFEGDPFSSSTRRSFPFTSGGQAAILQPGQGLATAS